MNNRINEIRRTIRALRVSMLEAEAIMHEQINRDEDCSFVAQELLKMRAVMSLLVRGVQALAHHAARIETFPSTLCHGDCHMGNLLRDAHNGLVWADWQEVGTGHTARDRRLRDERSGGRGVSDETIHHRLAARAPQVVLRSDE